MSRASYNNRSQARINLMQVIDIITEETAHRKGLTDFIDVWKSRQTVLETMGEETGLDILITNAYGKEGNHMTIRELILDHMSAVVPEDGEWSALIDKKLSGFHHGAKYSRHKEKYYRYVYNKDEANCRKYHEKMQEDELEMIEGARETHAAGNGVSYVINGGKDDHLTKNLPGNEEGFRLFCDEIQQFHKNRCEMMRIRFK